MTQRKKLCPLTDSFFSDLFLLFVLKFMVEITVYVKNKIHYILLNNMHHNI